MTLSAFAGTRRFQLRRKLGEGGMGAVYEAFDRERGAVVALKTLRHVDPAGIYRLKKEFRAVAELSHPNLVTLYELVNEGDTWFFTMDLVEGETFIEWVRRAPDGRRDSTATGGAFLDWMDPGSSTPAPAADEFDEARLRDGLRQLVQCLRSVHAAGRLHRDIKPSNVLVGADGRVHVLDFGLARASGAGSAYASLESAIVGTPAYMAPEQASGEATSTATDWYSVGVMLYEALTGVVPFGGSIAQLLTSKQFAEPPHPLEMVRGLPSDLAQLASDLLRRDPGARPTGDQIARRIVARGEDDSIEVPPSSRRELIGRRSELDMLATAASDARIAPVVVRIPGGAGVGKTTLLRRFMATLGDDAVVLAGRCRERESVPFKAIDPVIDCLARYLRSLPVHQSRAMLPRGVHALARLFPVLNRVEAIAMMSEDACETPDVSVFRQRAFEALRLICRSIARTRPLMLLMDDVHWGDGDSAALLLELLRPPDPPPLLVVLTHRGEVADSPLLERIEGSALQLGVEVRRISLEPLSVRHAARLADAILAGRTVRTRRMLSEFIAREGRGNPQLIAELARHVLAHGVTREDGPRLDEVFAARVTDIPAEQRRVLEVIAAAGPIDPRVVARAAGIHDIARVIAALGAAKAIRSVPIPARHGKPAGAWLDVFHERIREAVVSTAPRERLHQIHAAVAEALEGAGDPDPEQIAHHLEQSGAREAAGRRLLEAALAAGDNLAFDRAAHLLRRCLALSVDSVRHGWLSELLGDALAAGGRSAEAAAAYLRAAELAPTPDFAADAAVPPSGEERPKRNAVDLRRIAAEHLLRSGRIDEGLAVMRGVLEALELRMPKSPRGALMSTLYHRARLAVRGLELRHDTPPHKRRHQQMVMDACWSMAIGQSMVDTIAGADFHARHLLLALDAGDDARLARALALEAAHTAALGEHGRAEELLERADALGRALGDAHAVGLVQLMRGGQALFASRWRDAVRACDDAVRIFRDHCINVAWEIATASRFCLSALYFLGDLSDMSRRVANELAEARARGDRFAESCSGSGSAVFTWLAAGQVDVARRQLDEEAARWGDERFALQHFLLLQGQCYLDLYRGGGAHERLLQVWPRLERSQLLRVQLLRVTMLSLRARAALAAGSLRRAERDAKRLMSEGLPSASAIGVLLLAAAGAQRGREAEAIIGYQRAADALSSLNMRLYEVAARARLAALRGSDEPGVAAYCKRQRIQDWPALLEVIVPSRRS